MAKKDKVKKAWFDSKSKELFFKKLVDKLEKRQRKFAITLLGLMQDEYKLK